MIEVTSLKVLYNLPNKPRDGERAKCTNTGITYEYKEEVNDWVEFKPLTTYEYEKSLHSQLPGYDDEDLNKAAHYIDDIFGEELHWGDLFVLRNLELKYFTIFRASEKGNDSFGVEVINALCNVGQVLSCSYIEAGYISIWVKDLIDTYEFRLFNYNEGTIDVL